MNPAVRWEIGPCLEINLQQCDVINSLPEISWGENHCRNFDVTLLWISFQARKSFSPHGQIQMHKYNNLKPCLSKINHTTIILTWWTLWFYISCHMHFKTLYSLFLTINSPIKKKLHYYWAIPLAWCKKYNNMRIHILWYWPKVNRIVISCKNSHNLVYVKSDVFNTF